MTHSNSVSRTLLDLVRQAPAARTALVSPEQNIKVSYAGPAMPQREEVVR
jgi:hypothetical protein